METLESDEEIDNVKVLNKTHAYLEHKASYIDQIHNEPVYLWKIPFSDIRLNKEKYIMYFGKDVINEVLNCSGAMCFRDRINRRCGIIINEDKLYSLTPDTRLYIVYHELGHIVHKRFNNTESNVINEVIADRYAKDCGYRITSNVFTLAEWEVNSLVPYLPSHRFRFGISIFRAILFIKHTINAIIRKYL